jgi:menaquinol-cytochrome c reductase iron-sulfur subunit
MNEEAQVQRRGFLGLVTWAIGVLIGAGIGIPAIAYIVGPALKKESLGEWIPIGSPSKVELGTPTLFKANIERTTGWIVNEEELSAYVLTEDGRNFIAISNICSHLGCRVRWIADQDGFFCPCHNAVFNKEGQVISGPPPRPLSRFDIKVENNQLFLREA